MIELCLSNDFLWNKIARFITILLCTILCTATTAQVNSADTMRRIEIIGAKSLRQITIDTAVLQTLAGAAKVRQGNTILEGDSIVIDPATGIVEVFGNVHINDADTVNTYADYLKYIGNERTAYLKKNVKLTDGKATLTTNELIYNIATGIATYQNGGKVENGATVLTSSNGTYYSDTKDVLFKKNVHLKDPKYDITADSLLYNTEFKIANFIAPTHIITKDGIVDTKAGTYNLQTGEAIFSNRPVFRDSTKSITGRNVAFDEKSGLVQVEGNGRLVDSSNKIILVGDQILLDRKKNSFLGTRKPVMIIYQDNDSTYITADTLFSGRRENDSIIQKKTDTITTINSQQTTKDSIRYFLGFHHVRIFNDSIQAVSDSLYYSTEDSVFRLFYNPIVWNNKTQLTGDTMYMYTANQQPLRLEVFNNSFTINHPDNGVFNQISGRSLMAYFIKGQIDYIRQKGSPAECVYYPQDNDSAYIGMNRSNCDVIDIFFINKELNKVKFVNNVDGILYPLNQIPTDKKKLKGFDWQDHKRPKNKLELFE